MPAAPAVSSIANPDSPPAVGKQRLEALTDGLYSIALTLLVLELKVPALPHGADDEALRQALIGLLPRALTWLLSFWVMVMFWLAQLRLYRLSAALDWSMVWVELVQLALISLLPFSTALIGEYGSHVTAAVVYSANLLAIALFSWLRTAHFIRHAELHAPTLSPELRKTLRVRAWVLAGCCAASLLLAFFYPGLNMLAMLPVALLPVFARV